MPIFYIVLIVVVSIIALAVWMRIGLMIIILWLEKDFGVMAPVDVGVYLMALIWPVVVFMFILMPKLARPLVPKKYR